MNRAEFFYKLRLLPKSDRFFVRKAYDLMKATHKNQFRESLVDGARVPYKDHPRAAAVIAVDELDILDAVVIALLLIHDTVEDAEEASQLDIDYIEYLFDAMMAFRLNLLTIEKAPPDETGAQKQARKDRYVASLHRFADVVTLLVKAVDRLHNLRTLCNEGITDEKIARKTQETREKYLPLFEKMVAMAAGTAYANATVKLLAMIREELTRCETKLAERVRCARAAPGPVSGSDSGPPDPMEAG